MIDIKNFRSISNALLLSYIIVVVVPIFFISFITLRVLSENQKKEIANKNFILAKTLAAEVEEVLSEPENVIMMISEVLNKRSVLGPNSLNEFLELTIRQYPFLSMVQIIDADGKVTEVSPNDPDYKGIDVSNQNFFKKAKQFKTIIWSPTFISILSGEPNLTITVPLKDKMVVGYLNLEKLNTITENINPGNEMQAMILDEQGTIIAHSTKKELIYQRFNFSGFEPFREALNGNPGTYIDVMDKEFKLISIAIIPKTGWPVAVFQSTSNAFRSVDRTRNIFLIGIVISAAIAILLALWSLRSITRPLSEMQKKTGEIAMGNYNITLSDFRYREFNELAESFKVMTRAIKMRQDALEKKNKEIEKVNDELITNERKRKHLYGALLDKNSELEQILYVTSHDLRSPLVNIQGFSSELEKGIERTRKLLESQDVGTGTREEFVKIEEEDIKDSIAFINTSIKKMDSLLSGLLRLSRVGRAILTITTIDMNILIRNVLDTMEYRIKDLGFKTEVDLLPGCIGDEVQINQIFSNLIDNALKYRDPEKKGIIKITGNKKDDVAVYCVNDNGIGIKKEHQKKIFEIFYRLNYNDEAGEGLGLTIINKILTKNGGKIRVVSEYGKGSKFYVSLPVR
jgi:signal transduction histidine kinase